MSRKYIYIVLIFIIFILSTYTFSFNYFKLEQVKDVYNSNDLKCKYTISNIKENNDNYEILVYYPVTENSKLNSDILNQINSYIEKFKNSLNEEANTLTIKFNSFEHDIYTSFVFEAEVSNNNAHSDKYIFVSNFNNKENKVMTINDILINDNNSLKNISNAIYENIMKNDSIKEYIDDKSIKEYLDLNKEKYECFYFTKNAVVFCFNTGTILPKSAGVVYASISYDYIE